MAWMLRLECCPLVRNHSRFQVALWWIGIINPSKIEWDQIPKKTPDQALNAFSSKNRYSGFFSGVIFGRSCRSVFFWNFQQTSMWKIGRWRLKSWGWDIQIFGIKLGTFQNEVSKLANCSIVIVPFPYFPLFLLQLLLLLHAFHSIDVEFMLSLGIVQQGPPLNRHKRGGRNDVETTSAALGTDWFFQISVIFIGYSFRCTGDPSRLSHHCPGFFGRPCTKSIWTGKRVLKCWILDISILHSVGKAWRICIRWPVLKLWWMLSFAWSFAICGKPIPFPASHHHHAVYAYLCIGYDVEPSWGFPLIAM